MQTLNTQPSAFAYLYASPVKSDPDTETDEPDAAILRPLQNTPILSDGRSKLKSSLCKNFATRGFCPYGKKCQFAHGPEELRCNENINISYKTKPCFSYLKKGQCPYGHRCNFLHKDDSLPSKNILTQMVANFPEILLGVGGAQSRLMIRLQLQQQ